MGSSWPTTQPRNNPTNQGARSDPTALPTVVIHDFGPVRLSAARRTSSRGSAESRLSSAQERNGHYRREGPTVGRSEKKQKQQQPCVLGLRASAERTRDEIEVEEEDPAFCGSVRTPARAVGMTGATGLPTSDPDPPWDSGGGRSRFPRTRAIVAHLAAARTPTEKEKKKNAC